MLEVLVATVTEVALVRFSISEVSSEFQLLFPNISPTFILRQARHWPPGGRTDKLQQ